MPPNPEDGDGGDGGDETVLLFVAGERDRSLVADQVGDRHVVVGDPDDPLPEFDLCIVDTAHYPAVADALAERREAAAPVQVPVLALLGPRDGDAAAREVMAVADDVVSVPTSSEVLSARIESLLQTRRQSLELDGARDRLALYERAISQATIGVTITDADDDQPLTYVNDAFLDMTGYDREAVLGRNCRFLQGSDTDQGAVAELRAGVDAAEPVTTELVNYRADGEPFWSRVTVTPVRDDDGDLTHFLGFQEDVTERRSLRAALADERTTLTRLLNTSPVGIVVIDPEDGIVRANRTAEDILGRSRSELTAVAFDPASWPIEDAHGDPIPESELPFERVLADGESVRGFEFALLRDGERRWLSVNVAPLEQADGPRRAVVTLNDVTDRVEYARRLSVLDRVLRHNLRNKLNIVAGQAGVARDAGDADRVADALAEIETATEDLLAVADAVRRFHGTIDPTAEDDTGPRDVAAVCRRAVADVQSADATAVLAAGSADTAWAETHDLLEPVLVEALAAMTDDPESDSSVDVAVREGRDEVVVRIEHDGDPLGLSGRNALQAGEESPLEHTTDVELWLARWMAANSGGRLTVDGDGDATVVNLHFPAVDPPDGD